MIRSIAVAQTCPVKGGIAANADEHARLTQIAASEGAQILVFPELSLTGYELDDARDLAFTEDDPRLSDLMAAASAGSMIMIVGAPVRIGQKIHIGAFILYPDGTIDLYTKHRLGAFSTAASCDGSIPPAEATVFEPGDRDPLLRVGESVAAVAVCADIGRSSHPQHAAARGATVYLASMFVIPSEFDRDAAKLREYAVQHSMVVALANFGSPTGGLAAAGRSSIWSENGELLVELGSSGAAVAIATEDQGIWRSKAIMLGDHRKATLRG